MTAIPVGKAELRRQGQGIAILADIYILGKYKRPLVLKLPPEKFVPEE